MRSKTPGSLSGEAKTALHRQLQPRLTAYVPHKPHARQQAGLILDDVLEVGFGGAAGGGKSDWLLMSALQYADVPGYAALIVRRTHKQLAMEGGLLERSHKWLRGRARWNDRDSRWEFNEGSSLTFGYLENKEDETRYDSSEFQFIGVDELQQFDERQYLYLFSRLRRTVDEHPALAKIPLRIRASFMPGGRGHVWVKQRFITETPRYSAENKIERVFLPSFLVDNPSLNADEYRRSLQNLLSVDRQRLLEGNWNVTDSQYFRRDWFEVVADYPKPAREIRYWDTASSPTGDFTSGARVAEHDGVKYIVQINRFQGRAAQVETAIENTAKIDGARVEVGFEIEPGSQGDIWVAHMRRQLRGFTVRTQRAASQGNKEKRAYPWLAAAEAGNVKLVQGPWISAFLDEGESFPGGEHDDQIDAVSGACQILDQGRSRQLITW